jgi:hypothetical protein
VRARVIPSLRGCLKSARGPVARRETSHQESREGTITLSPQGEGRVRETDLPSPQPLSLAGERGSKLFQVMASSSPGSFQTRSKHFEACHGLLALRFRRQRAQRDSSKALQPLRTRFGSNNSPCRCGPGLSLATTRLAPCRLKPCDCPHRAPLNFFIEQVERHAIPRLRQHIEVTNIATPATICSLHGHTPRTELRHGPLSRQLRPPTARDAYSYRRASSTEAQPWHLASHHVRDAGGRHDSRRPGDGRLRPIFSASRSAGAALECAILMTVHVRTRFQICGCRSNNPNHAHQP